MKNSGTILFLLLLLLFVSCDRDLEQSLRYSEMLSECDSLIARVKLVINNQGAKGDSLRKLRADGIADKIPEYRLLRIDREITDVAKVESDAGMIIKHLEAIKTFAKVGEKVNKRIIYFKRKYINYSTAIQVHDENIMIQEITEGLTAKQFIARYLP